MSSKGKKTSRPSRNAAAASASPSPSSHNHSRSPKTPSTPAREPDSNGGGGGGDEARLLRLLSAASAKYPNLIRDSALCARISDSDPSPSKDNQAKLWLSHAAMVSASLTPGSLVLVSIPASPKSNSDESPLAPLADEDNGTESGLGHYFAVATVFPSGKIIKDDAKLSWGLSCTMDFPDTGSAIFVSPIGSESQRFQIRECKELYLNMVPQKDGPAAHGKALAAPGALSPKTPSSSSGLRFSSPGDSPLRPGKSQESLRSMDSSSRWDTSAARLALEDEKVNELLRIHAARWLYGRRLLVGNLVTVPICGQLYAFRVKGEDSALGGSSDLDGVDAALLVGTGTKVHLCDPKSSTERNPNRTSLVIGDPAVNSTKGKEAGHIRRLGGLSKEYTALKEIITFSFESKNSLPSFRYKGVLLHGPPGTGKTSLASCCARDTGANLFSINGPEIVSQYYGESEQALHGIFDSAKRDSPAVVFIDELDAIAPARKDGGEELSLRMVATLLKLMDEINVDDNVLVIAATNRPDSIDPALRRPGRLDKEIEIGVPSPDQRLDILQTLLSGMDHSLNSTEIQSLAFATHGFVGADLAALCNEAAMIALRRHIKLKSSGNYIKELSSGQDGAGIDMHHTDVCKDGQFPSRDDMVSLLTSLSELTVSSKPTYPVNIHGAQEHCSTSQCGLHEPHKVGNEMLLKVTAVDFEKAKMKVRPSAMREVLIELPKVRWEDVGGQTKVKKQLIEAVQWPQICPDAFERIGIRPPRGLLMIGPPGCSKTLMARAVASESKLNFLAVKGPELFSKWVGESEKAVKSLFAKARENSPAIIFFDEIDGLAVTRGEENDGTSVADRVLSQLLVEMDGLDQRINVTVIAATNRPDKIDHALLRPGRFDRLLDVQPPDQTDREAIFRIHMRDIPCSSSVSAKDLASLTEGYTGADIKLICREAAIAALEESLDIPEVSMAHFHIGVGRVQPSDVQFYKELAAQFRRFVDIGSARDE